MLVARGLHTMPFLSRDGNPIIYAVDSASRFVAWRDVPEGADPVDVKRELRADLDAADPQEVAS